MKLLKRISLCVNATGLILNIALVLSIFMAKSFGVDMDNEVSRSIVSVIFIPFNLYFVIEYWPWENKI